MSGAPPGGSPHVTGPAGRRGRILVGCFRGMGDLLYVSSILAQLRQELPADIGIDLATGRGLWADAVRHVPCVDRVVPVDSWEEIDALGASGYEETRVARVSKWMPYSKYRGWTLRARIQRLHLIDVLARTLDVKLRPAHRRPVYTFDPGDPEDAPAAAEAAGRFVVVALHGFTNARYNDAARERLQEPLIAESGRTGLPLVLVGPQESAPPLPASVIDLRGAPIRRVAAFVNRAALVVTILNGMTVLADALERPLLLAAVGSDPLPVVGPIVRKPVAILGRTGRAGAASVDVDRLLHHVREFAGADGPHRIGNDG